MNEDENVELKAPEEHVSLKAEMGASLHNGRLPGAILERDNASMSPNTIP